MNKELLQDIQPEKQSVIRCKNCGASLQESGSKVLRENRPMTYICNNCGYIQTITLRT